MIRNIVFDMGNVLIRFDREFFIRRLGVNETEAGILMREVFVSLEWAQLDRGSLREEEAVRRICTRVPEHLHEAVQKLVTMWDRPILPIEGMEELLKELKAQGYGLYLLSNASVRQHEYWPRYTGSRLFDGSLISADVKLVKPQTEIYQTLFRKYALKPEECIFIDDSPINVEGSVFSGMDAIVFYGDAKRLRAELRNKGVEI